MAALIQAGRTDVFVFSNDDMAVGGVCHFIAENIAVKQELALFGFNGLDVGQPLPKPLSMVKSNRFRIGTIAVEQILSRPERNGMPTTIDTGFEIFDGETA